MKYGGNNDPYLDENGILKNCLGAKSENALDLAEMIFVLRKLALLFSKRKLNLCLAFAY